MQSKELRDEDIARVRAYAEERRVIFLCTAHDDQALDFIDKKLNVSAFKIGSGEVENWPYLENVARRGKPIILSTGMYTLEQVRKASEVIWDAGGRELALLHCVTSYPTPPAQVNLDAMRQIGSIFSGPVGYSDHTVGTVVSLAAVALGAKIVEKHITLDINVPNAHDWKVSCTAETLAPFVAAVRDTEAALGGWEKAPVAAEEAAVKWARKSITAAIDLARGHVLEASDVQLQRPGSGLPPSQLPSVLGRRVSVPVQAGTPITSDMLQ
jgi:N-acetylneuraminate synthase/N,N'-diacetyllegionaminate synthase